MNESVQPRHETMHSEAIPTHDDVVPLGELVDHVLGTQLVHGLTSNQRASIAWHACNGDRERAHTTRVFLKKPRNEESEPIICVYVDSHSFLTDLMANKDLYLARLANWGFYVSGIQFSVDRTMQRRGGSHGAKTQEQSVTQKLEVPPQELLDKVQDMVRDMPESLQTSISKAILASLITEGEK